MKKDRVLEGLGFVTSSTKYKIWKIVFQSYPIKAADVRRILLRRYKVDVGLENVRSHLKDLVEKKWLKKTGITVQHLHYMPNRHWISKLAGTFSYLDQIVSRDQEDLGPLKRLYDLDFIESRSQWEEFRSLADFETWLIDFEKENRADVISSGRHLWWILEYLGQAKEMMSTVKRNNHEVIGICSEDSPIARLQILKGKGDLAISLAINPESATNPYTYITGDWVIFAYYPEAVNSQVAKYFKNCKKIEQVPIKDFDELLNTKNPVTICAIENKKIAKNIKWDLKKAFKTAIFP